MTPLISNTPIMSPWVFVFSWFYCILIPGRFTFPECHINPSPGRCLESQQKTFWTFSSKTSACTRVTGCYSIRDRNTWMTRAGCESGCIVNETQISETKPLGRTKNKETLCSSSSSAFYVDMSYLESRQGGDTPCQE